MLEGSALISFGTWLTTKIADKGFDAVYNKLLSSEKITEKFNKAVDKTSKLLQEKYPNVLGGSINYFFSNDSVFNELIKLLFVDSKIDENIISTNFDVKTLPENFIYEFVITLKDQVRKDPILNNILSNKEIFILIQGLSEKTRLISQNSTLALSEIVQIKKLLQNRLGSFFSYDDFIDIYYKNALDNLSQVNFLGLGVDIAIKRKRKNLQDVFIKPFFELVNKDFASKNILDKNEDFFEFDNNPISYEEVLNHSDKNVVLGNPGSGKSVLIKSLICDIIQKNSFAELKTFPLRIELRKYLSYKKTNHSNLLKYVVYLLESEYNVYNLTDKIITDIFSNQKVYIFFDGLDEIFKIEDKISIKNDIENFHNYFPKIHSLTTSRIIGYDDAKLKEDEFCELTILGFDDKQIKEYITKWYDKEEENVEIRQKEVSGFISKMHEIDRELVSNPLLLSLIVILYRNILKLPESKLEIYQSCTKTLVDKWDASKDLEIDIEVSIYKNKEKIFADLAYWQYQQLSGDNVVISYDKAKKTVAKSIIEKLNDSDNYDCESLAESFMEYAQKRSIYFDNNFTHKTFLEYYTAYWIYSNIEKKHKILERNNIISKYINNSFWHIVLELLLNMIDKDQADSEIIDNLINIQLEQPNDALPFLLNTVTSFKNISVSKISNVIELAIFKIISFAKVSKSSRYDFPRHKGVEFQVYDAFKQMYANDIIGKKLIIELMNQDKFIDSDLRKHVYILYFEMELILRIHSNNLNPDVFVNKVYLDEEVNKSPYLFQLYHCYFNDSFDDLNGIFNYIENFGVDSIFKSHSAVFDSFGLGSFFDSYFHTQILSENIPNISENLEKLEKVGLSKVKITEYISNHYRNYNFFAEDFKVVIQNINSIEDYYVKRILMIILFSSKERSDDNIEEGINDIELFKEVVSTLSK